MSAAVERLERFELSAARHAAWVFVGFDGGGMITVFPKALNLMGAWCGTKV